MKITLVEYTENAKELLILSKNTRHLGERTGLAEIKKMLPEEQDKEIGYIFSTIGSSLEFVNYVFLIQEVTRAFTHQLVRHRVGTSFAQESLRVVPETNFSYFIPDGIESDQYKLAIYDSAMAGIQEGYNLLLNKGANVQDARGVLPTNICTNILLGINLRALATLMETRLCVRAQGEFQLAAAYMREFILEIHPWAEPVMYPTCITKDWCQFPRFKNCPIKNKYDHLKPVEPELREGVKDYWSVVSGFSPQPDRQQ